MGIKFTENENKLTVFLSGEIDHHSASFLRDCIDKKITSSQYRLLDINFNEVTFMDSSAIGLVMGRYRTAKSNNCTLSLSGLSERNKMLMKMAGLEKIIKFEVSE